MLETVPLSDRPSTETRTRFGLSFRDPLLLQSSFGFSSRTHRFRWALCLPGFRPYSRHHRRRPLTARHPKPHFVPPSGFHNLSVVCSVHRFRRLISSRSHVQGSSRSGASLSAQPHRLIGDRCPLAVALAPLTGYPVATIRSLDFEALLRAK